MLDLLNPTGNPIFDDVLKAIITVYEAAFPARIRAYYAVGSLSNGTAIATSDIDLAIVLKDALHPDEAPRLELLKASLRVLAPVHLDLVVYPEADFMQHDTVALVQASRLLYGQDSRADIPLPPIERYLRHISTPTQRGLTQRFRTPQVTLPLAYPLPDDPYYGYLPARYADDPAPAKLWVLNVGWLATFLVVRAAGVYVPSKSALLDVYRQHISDEWTDFIAAVYRLGRQRWHYTIPDDPAGDELLRDLMRRTLAFENHVAQHYIAYLREELEAGDADLARERLRAFAML